MKGEKKWQFSLLVEIFFSRKNSKINIKTNNLNLAKIESKICKKNESNMKN